MFIIASGEAVVEISPGQHALLKEGDFFGEMALLEHRRHKHDVVAKTRCRVYVLDSTSLARLKRRHPEIMQHIRKMAEARALAMSRRDTKAASARQAQPAKPRHDRPWPCGDCGQSCRESRSSKASFDRRQREGRGPWS